MVAEKSPSLTVAFGLPPERAVEYFGSRGLRVAGDWRAVAAAVRAGSFSVAGVAKAQVLEDIRAALQEAIESGQSYTDFKRGLRATLQAAGWWGGAPLDPETGEILPGKALTPRRLATVFRTNLQGALMAGRYKGMVEAADTRPYWQYVAILDDRTRPRHRALAGRVFRWDDPVWRVIYPPNGYNCRCRVRPLSESDMEREGLSLSRGEGRMETIEVDLGPRGGRMAIAGYRDPGTGELFAPDPGFDHNPSERWALDVELARRVAAIRSSEIRTQVWQALNNSPERLAAFADWTERALGDRLSGHDAQVVGFIGDPVADFMLRVLPDAEPARVAIMDRRGLLHADSEKHAVEGIALNREQYPALPGIVAAPDAVYFDRVHRNFVFVRDLADGGVIYLAVTPAYELKRIGRLDALVNAYRLPPGADGAGRLRTGRYLKMGSEAE